MKSRLLLSILLTVCGVFGMAYAPPVGSKPAYDLGPIIVSTNGHFLQHKDGRPFFWLGDTAWNLFQRLDREEAERYLENRRSKGFNVIQAVAFHGSGEKNAYGSEALLENDAGRSKSIWALFPENRYGRGGTIPAMVLPDRLGYSGIRVYMHSRRPARRRLAMIGCWLWTTLRKSSPHLEPLTFWNAD